MVKKMFLMGVCLMVCLGLFAGCGEKIPYNAVLYDDMGNRINTEFKAANATTGVISDDDDLPKSRVWLITTQADFNDKITSVPFDYDFEKHSIVIYTFTSVYATRHYNLSDLALYGDNLKIEYVIEKNKDAVGNATQPTQRWFIIKLDKTTAISAQFIEKK